MKVCTFWLTCPCSCHKTLSDMFAIAESERLIMDNPEYVPAVASYWMPEPGQMFEESKPVVVEKSGHVHVPDTVVKEFDGTETGRSGRGQLEYNVKLACDAWIKAEEPGLCDTKYVSEWIYNNLGTPGLPSRGAIDAVWKRWVELGFAFTITKPNQFLCYTPEGVKLGLDAMKAQHKSDIKRRLKAQALGRR